MRLVRLRAHRRESTGALDVHGRIAGVADGADLALYDLRDEEPAPFASVAGVEAFALGEPWSGSGATAAASLASGELSVLRIEEGRARTVATLDPKALALGGTGPATALALSKSGRYLAASFPIRDPQRVGVALVDLHDGTVHGWFRPSLAMRAGFARMPSGAEVLFLSADSYLDVKMVDCASGRTLASYPATSSFDFVHVAFALSDDATRLFTFGCIWGAPYEVRLYDARPWTEGAPEARGPFPLPLVLRDDWATGSALPAFPTKTADGAFTHVSLVDGSPPGEDDLAWVEARRPEEVDVRRWWRERPGRSGVVVRRVDPADGRILGWSAFETERLREERVHTADGHRVIAFGARAHVLHADGGREDAGDASGDVVATGVTADGAIGIVLAR